MPVKQSPLDLLLDAVSNGISDDWWARVLQVPGVQEKRCGHAGARARTDGYWAKCECGETVKTDGATNEAKVIQPDRESVTP